VTTESEMVRHQLAFAPSPPSSGAVPAELFTLPNLTMHVGNISTNLESMVRLGNANNSAGPEPLEAGLGANAS